MDNDSIDVSVSRRQGTMPRMAPLIPGREPGC